MDRWILMSFRMYGPAVLALVVGAISAGLLARFGASPLLAGVAATFAWVPYAALVGTVLFGAWATWRVSRARRGIGVLCPCGCALGAERDGRYGPYRKCLGCSKNVARKYYAHLE